MEAANKFRSAEMMAQVTGQLCDIIFPIGIYYMNRLIEEGWFKSQASAARLWYDFDSSGCVMQYKRQNFWIDESVPVLLSRPSKDGFARLDGHLGKIARLTPVFL